MDGCVDMKKIICLGETLIDFKYENDSFIMNAGGAPANVSAIISKLGGNAYIITKLAKDIFSSFLIDALNKYNVNLDYVSYTDKYKTDCRAL